MITIFFVTMNVLLWRAEFGEDRENGTPIPVGVVWQKILTAPDDSTLEIYRSRKKVGYCRWVANVGEELATGKVAVEETQPEGMVKTLKGYSVEFEGNLIVAEPTSRLRFALHLEFSTNMNWQSFTTRLGMRPNNLEIKSSAASERVRFTFENDIEHWDREFAYDELRNPQKLLEEFGVALLPGLLPSFSQSTNMARLNMGLEWKASNSWLKMGHSQVRVYRLQARLFDRYQAVVVVSRVGELLRVELPFDLLLVNDAISHF
jgi:hypothetical protein